MQTEENYIVVVADLPSGASVVFGIEAKTSDPVTDVRRAMTQGWLEVADFQRVVREELLVCPKCKTPVPPRETCAHCGLSFMTPEAQQALQNADVVRTVRTARVSTGAETMNRRVLNTAQISGWDLAEEGSRFYECWHSEKRAADEQEMAMRASKAGLVVANTVQAKQVAAAKEQAEKAMRDGQIRPGKL